MDKKQHLTLPRDLFEVQIIAAVFGFNLAFSVRTPANDQHLQVLALTGGREYLRVVRVNDEQAYLAEFAVVAPRAYQAMIAALDTSAALVLHLKTFQYGSAAYLTELHRGALHNIQRLLAGQEEPPAHLTITWPSFEMMEVA